MTDSGLDISGRRLLSLLQSGFPLSREPFADLGSKLGISGGVVIERIHELKSKGVVRQISPVLDARKLGYQSTLVALKIADERVHDAERYLAGHSGISHGYEREHEFNIWITLSLPPGQDLQRVLQELSSHTGAEAIITLPALRVFKLRTDFGLDEEGQPETDARPDSIPSRAAGLSQTERRIINRLQNDLPLTADPFKPLAERLNMSVDDLLQHSNLLLKKGAIRRYGASINHYRAGYKANAMTCWIAPRSRVDDIGRRLASFRQVSHCYERQTNPLWSYNVFAMVHSQSKEGCLHTITRMSEETGMPDYTTLFSTREFIKTRIRYHV
jgi:DNA-binding Lrp family transcriptional regulator